jgi:acylglycerol lipase
VVTDYENDPLNYRGKIPANTGRQMNLAMQAAMAGAASIKVPLLIIHGSADRLTEVSGAQLLAERVGSADTTVRIWDGAYHELHNEPEREQVLDEVATWVLAHSSPAA